MALVEWMLFQLTLVAVGAVWNKIKQADEPRPDVRLERVITLVGRTGVGKSSTANALLGRDAAPTGLAHGTTETVREYPWVSGYCLRDTPGILDRVDYRASVLAAVADSELVIFVVTGQLYRQELELLGEIHELQHRAKQAAPHLGPRKLALYVNQIDIQRQTRLPAELATERALLEAQVSSFVAPQQIIYGAAAPVAKGARARPEIDALCQLIERHIQKRLQG